MIDIILSIIFMGNVNAKRHRSRYPLERRVRFFIWSVLRDLHLQIFHLTSSKYYNKVRRLCPALRRRHRATHYCTAKNSQPCSSI